LSLKTETKQAYFSGSWDFLALNHYTTFFPYVSQEDSEFVIDTRVANILDDMYATSSAEWQQVSRPETAKIIHHIEIYK
jgi:hypothetical protein